MRRVGLRSSQFLFATQAAYGHSGNTPPEGLEAPFIYIENGEDSLLAQASGCIALLNITILFLSATVPTTTLPAVQSSWSFAAFLRITPCAVLAALYGAEQKKSDSRAVGIMRVPSVLIHSVKLC